MSSEKSALDDLIEIAEEGLSYTPKYFAEKWGMASRLDDAKKAAATELAALRENNYPGYLREKQIRINLEKQVESLTAERDALKALLKQSEWFFHPWCYSCGSNWSEHAPDCRLAAALKEKK